MTGTLILIAAAVVTVVGALLFMIIRASPPLAVETSGQVALVRRRLRDPVSGTLQVTGITEPSFDGTDCTALLTGVLSGEGIEPRAVQRKGMLAVARWPSVGQQLPVIIDRANPKLFFIDQSAMIPRADAALAEAERLAAAMKDGGD